MNNLSAMHNLINTRNRFTTGYANTFHYVNKIEQLSLTFLDELRSEQSKNKIIEFKGYFEASHLLPKLLSSLAMDDKFITLIGSPHQIDRSWLKNQGLPLSRFMQINSGKPTIQNMRLVLKSLSTGNSSATICWLPELSDEQKEQIMQAAEYGNSLAIIMPTLQLH